MLLVQHYEQHSQQWNSGSSVTLSFSLNLTVRVSRINIVILFFPKTMFAHPLTSCTVPNNLSFQELYMTVPWESAHTCMF